MFPPASLPAGDTHSPFCLIFSNAIDFLPLADTIISTIQMYHLKQLIFPWKSCAERKDKMTLTQKRILILLIIIIIAAVLGRLAFRAFLNVLLGGTMWGGNFLWKKRKRKAEFGTPEYDEEIKDISALLWVNENSIPTLLAYGKYDKVQPYEGSQRLLKALEDNQVPHDYYLYEHSGHGLQNDNQVYGEYMRKILEYLDMYMPVK